MDRQLIAPETLDFSTPESTEQSLISIGVVPIYPNQSRLVCTMITRQCDISIAAHECGLSYQTARGYMHFMRGQFKRLFNLRTDTGGWRRVYTVEFIHFLMTGRIQ